MDAFACFDAIAYVGAAGVGPVQDRMRRRFVGLGIEARVQYRTALATPGDPRIGVILDHRRAVADAQEQGARSVLVLSGDVLFLDRSRDILAAASTELAQWDWPLCYLGGWWPVVLEPQPGTRHLDRAEKVSNPHAVAYGRRLYSRILEDWPAEATDVADWTARHGDLDAYLGRVGGGVVIHPVITTVPALLPFEHAASHQHFSV